mmetsp:Transcript_57055/g.133861  ORF Transcript_57055/g.133861 Transcript_57055/m.133861 type:complete len:140 (+) Transcript_57055:127-546(+)
MSDDFGLKSAGTEVTFVSCQDERHPSENIIDGNDKTFWVTTGLFPQQIILQFANEVEITKIKTATTNVRGIIFESCVEKQPTEFQKMYDVEIADRNGRLQMENNQVPATKALFLRVTIDSGWDDFASVRRIAIEGTKTG